MTTTSPTDLIDRLRELLADYQDLAAKHKEELDRYRDSDGNVVEDRYAEYDETRITAAIESSEHLDTLVGQLTRLVGPLPPRTFTLTYSGLESIDGESPSQFAVLGNDLSSARHDLEQLPSFQEWCTDQIPHNSPGAAPVVQFRPDQSRPGLPTPDPYIDLRSEQERLAAARSRITPLPGRPSPTPANAPRVRHR